ncbi:3-keto-5-aminohexanoate cleavage protein [soil metagenome]
MVLVKACLNGARHPSEHPLLPVTPAELAADVGAVTAVGAGAVHLHVKDVEGADTFDGLALADVLRAVRSASPNIPLGVTTGAWVLPDPAERVAAIRRWMVLPEFASVNWHEPGADAVAAALLERGVGVEAGLWHAEAVLAWLASPVRDQCFRVLIELPDGLEAAKTVVEADHLINLINDGMQDSAADVRVLRHGEGTSCWPALMHAGRRGLSTRIGLEDVLTLPDGDPAPDNASLVAAAIDLLRPCRVS